MRISDWSSDVCSSDLSNRSEAAKAKARKRSRWSRSCSTSVGTTSISRDSFAGTFDAPHGRLPQATFKRKGVQAESRHFSEETPSGLLQRADTNGVFNNEPPRTSQSLPHRKTRTPAPRTEHH